MLLALRSLWEEQAAATSERIEATHANRGIQRKLRRLAQWSEAIAPPRVSVVVTSDPIHVSRISDHVAEGEVTTTAHVRLRAARQPIILAPSIAQAARIDVSVPLTLALALALAPALNPGDIESHIDLFEEEFLMLLIAA